MMCRGRTSEVPVVQGCGLGEPQAFCDGYYDGIDAPPGPPPATPPAAGAGDGEREPQAVPAPALSWPRELRAVRVWLTPWTALQRWWTAWSTAPPPPQLQALINSVTAGQGLDLYLPP